jgi:hypothetical protein
VTVDPSAQQAPAPGQQGIKDVEKLTATILTAVEKQLTRYFSAMSQQAETTRALVDQTRTELAQQQLSDDARKNLLAEALTLVQVEISKHQTDQGALIDAAVERAVAVQREANDAYQAALQTALEERLAEFANHQHWRLSDLEDKVAALPTDVGVGPEAILEIRQTVRDDMEHQFATVHGRIDELGNTARRFDEQSSALVQHVNDSTAALAKRMDEGDERVAHAVEERLGAFQAGIEEAVGDLGGQLNDHAQTLLGKIDSAEERGTDRLLALEARINDDQGQKIANLEAAIGRVGSGFDDAMVAISQRVLELENRIFELDDRIGEMNERLSKIDQDALDAMKSELSKAVGEAMLVRIELDRAVANTDEKIDRQSIRMSEIEGLLTDQMDVSAAVQLERLDELERQMAMIDPMKVGGGSMSSTVGPVTGSVPRTLPSMSLNPRLPGADSTPNGDDGMSSDMSVEAEAHLSSH